MPHFYGDIIADFCRKINGQTPQKSSAKFCRVHNTDIICPQILKICKESQTLQEEKFKKTGLKICKKIKRENFT